jgi:probable rRNA maturation factor
MAITFQTSGDLGFTPRGRKQLREWIRAIASREDRNAGELNFVFMTDKELLKFNRQYLAHDDYTDIITFDYSDGKIVAGDILISIERVTDNAKKFNVSFDDELHRVMAHGILHLCGYKDKSAGAAKEMRKKEEDVLRLKTRPAGSR